MVKKASNNAPALMPLSKLSRMQKILLAAGLAILTFSALPAVLIVTVGLLPTFTLILTDRGNTNKLLIVGCFNLAGVFVCLMNIFSNFELGQAFHIVSNIFNLVIMLGAAALGVVFYYELPNIFVSLSKVSLQKRLEKVNRKLGRLAEEWGQDLVDTSEP